MTEKFKTKSYLVTISIQKAFDSLDHNFLLAILENLRFGTNFIDWIKIFINDQELHVIYGSVTAQYFKLQKGVQQGDPVSVYLFILCLEILFTNVKEELNKFSKTNKISIL